VKILIVSQYFYPENFKVNDLAVSLKERGHDITVLTGKPNYPEGRFYKGYGFFSKRKEEYNGIIIFRVPLIPRGKSSGIMLFLNYFSFVLTSCLFILFHRERYDVTFVFATSPITVAFPAILYRKKYKTLVRREVHAKTLLWVLDLWPESVGAASNISMNTANKLLTGMVKYIYRNVDKVLISSQGFKKSVMDKNVPENKVYYAPNWAENAFEEAENIDFEKYANMIPRGFIVMFTGNIGEAQDCEAILMTAKELKNRQNDAQIVMVGDGRKRSWLQEQATKLVLNNIHFTGRYPLEEMPNIIAHADVLLVSLKDEPIFSLTVPAKIQSYLASKKPILVMLNGEGAEIVKNSSSGLTCSSGDYISLVDNIEEMQKKTSEERIALGIAGYEYYTSMFLREKVISDIEAIMDK